MPTTRTAATVLVLLVLVHGKFIYLFLFFVEVFVRIQHNSFVGESDVTFWEKSLIFQSTIYCFIVLLLIFFNNFK